MMTTADECRLALIDKLEALRPDAIAGGNPEVMLDKCLRIVERYWQSYVPPSPQQSAVDNGNAAMMAAQDWLMLNGTVITISEADDLVNAIRPHLSHEAVSLECSCCGAKPYLTLQHYAFCDAKTSATPPKTDGGM
jgi:hypothetical protein